MMCLTSWAGVAPTFKSNSLRLVFKLSGKFLGFLHVDSKLSTFETMKDLQDQASKLMRHQTRLSRDILFWKEQEELLPQGFAYMESLELNEEDRINKLFEEAKQQGLSMMYNEDDLWAKQRCSHVFCANIFGAPHGICVKVGDDKLPNELLHFENHGITTWSFYSDNELLKGDLMVKHIMFLKGAQRCEEVVFIYIGTNKESHALGYTGNALKQLLTKLKRLDPNI